MKTLYQTSPRTGEGENLVSGLDHTPNRTEPTTAVQTDENEIPQSRYTTADNQVHGEQAE